jgi:hypothetical protein
MSLSIPIDETWRLDGEYPLTINIIFEGAYRVEKCRWEQASSDSDTTATVRALVASIVPDLSITLPHRSNCQLQQMTT